VSPEDGYTLDDCRAVVRRADDVRRVNLREYAAARIALREHERAEALAQRVADLEAAAEAYRLDGAAMEARALRAEAAVGVLVGQFGGLALSEAAAAAEWAGILLSGHCVYCDDGRHLGGLSTPFGVCRYCDRTGPDNTSPTTTGD